MSLSTNDLSTAGKITVLTTFLGVVAFAVIFFLNIGTQEFQKAEAQSDTASTTLTVINTPPQWTVEARELTESSTTSPTNVGDVVSWIATGTDSNAQDYWLLICSNNATPTPNSGAAPACDSSATQWAVSASTTSGTQATAATTTLAAWAESNAWYAFICDGDSVTPRCNNSAKQGTTTPQFASPFEVNHRPVFTAFYDDSPADPGVLVTFYSTSSDSDVSGTADTVRLWVCNDADFNTTTDQCGPGGTIASSTIDFASDATSTYTIVIPTQDQSYTAYGYIIDSHGFEASGGSQGTDSTLTVNNVAPTVTAATISINGGSDLAITVAAGETTGFTLEFTTSDNNSCDAVGGGNGDEVVDYDLSLYRSGIGASGCVATTTLDYDPNNCYNSINATTTWNLSCTASTTSCGGASFTTMEWDCTFPLWYIADPTDGTATSTQYPGEDWRAAVTAYDDDNATGTPVEGTTPVEVTSLLAFDITTLEIPYGTLEPGNQTDPIVATSTAAATGNVGIDHSVSGDDMCPGYLPASPCSPSSTSTIPADEQVYATSTVSYASGVALSSTTPAELEINVQKSTTTSTQATADAYWGIRVPGTITLSGSYTGQNTFTVITGESADW